MQPSAPHLRGATRMTAHRTNTAWSSVVCAAGGAHTWSTPQEMHASTAHDAHWLFVRTNTAAGGSGVRSDQLVRVHGGAGGSEYVIAGPIEWGGRQANAGIALPVYVPAGTRLSISTKGARNLTMQFSVEYLQTQGNAEGWPTKWVGYGIVDDGSNSRGTIVTPGSTNAWGSWTTLVASTTYPHSLWVPMAGTGSGSALTALNYRMQYAVASAANAATMATNGTVIEGTTWTGATTELVTDNIYGVFTIGFVPWYDPKPAGSEVVGRVMCSGAPDTNMTSLSILGAVI